MFQLFTYFSLMVSSSNTVTYAFQEEYRQLYVEPDCHARSRFVYVKMIKCASSVLNNVFRRFGLQRKLSFVLPPKKRIYIGWPYPVDDSFYRPSKSTSGFDILCDHVLYDRQKFSELMGKDMVYITSMREPFSQVKSMVNYYNVLNISGVPMSVANRFTEFMSNLEKYEAVYKSAEASPTRFCIPNGFSMTRNLMSFNLGFPTGGFRSVDEDLAHDDDRMQQWIVELDTEFSLVIIVEHFYESMILLRRLMCWSLPDILFNVTRPESYEHRNEEKADLVKFYHQWSSVDYQLYHHFNNTLWKKITAQVTALVAACLNEWNILSSCIFITPINVWP